MLICLYVEDDGPAATFIRDMEIEFATWPFDFSCTNSQNLWKISQRRPARNKSRFVIICLQIPQRCRNNKYRSIPRCAKEQKGVYRMNTLELPGNEPSDHMVALQGFCFPSPYISTTSNRKFLSRIRNAWNWKVVIPRNPTNRRMCLSVNLFVICPT